MAVLSLVFVVGVVSVRISVKLRKREVARKQHPDSETRTLLQELSCDLETDDWTAPAAVDILGHYVANESEQGASNLEAVQHAAMYLLSQTGGGADNILPVSESQFGAPLEEIHHPAKKARVRGKARCAVCGGKPRSRHVR